MAGTVVLTDTYALGQVRTAVITATADAADGTFPATTLAALGLGEVSGTLLALQTNPGATAPTDNYDITLIDADGLDRLNSVGLNRDTTNSERVAISGTPFVAAGETLTLTIANNAVNSAVVVLRLFWTSTANASSGSVTIESGSVTASGSVSLETATTGGYSASKLIDIDETEDEVKASAGTVGGWVLTNIAASTRYVRFYNATAANVTVGTTAATIIVAIPAGAGVVMPVGGPGIAFSTAICIAATTGVADNDTGAPGANEVVGTVFYV